MTLSPFNSIHQTCISFDKLLVYPCVYIYIYQTMKGSKLDITEKAFRLLYKASSHVVRPKVNPLAARLLQGQKELPSLTSLMGSEPKDIQDAPLELGLLSNRKIETNMLKISTKNCFLKRQDTEKLLPPRFEQTFNYDRIPFDFVKSRDPKNLDFNNAYYLLFPDFANAAAYWLETRYKSLNSQRISLQFSDPIKEIPFMYFDSIQHLKRSKYLNVKQEDKAASDFLSIGSTSKQPPFPASPGSLPGVPSHKPLLRDRDALPSIVRENVVLLKNVAGHMTQEEWLEILFDYDTYEVEEEAVRRITNDDFRNTWCVVFSNRREAERCVFQFNGTHLYNDQRMPVICAETLD